LGVSSYRFFAVAIVPQQELVIRDSSSKNGIILIFISVF